MTIKSNSISFAKKWHFLSFVFSARGRGKRETNAAHASVTRKRGQSRRKAKDRVRNRDPSPAKSAPPKKRALSRKATGLCWRQRPDLNQLTVLQDNRPGLKNPCFSWVFRGSRKKYPWKYPLRFFSALYNLKRLYLPPRKRSERSFRGGKTM